MKGDFTIFGFATDPRTLLERTLPQRLGAAPRRFDFGEYGALFYYSTYAEIAETEEVVGLKLGFLRLPDKAPLTTRAVLQKGIVSPQHVDAERLHGNGLVACLSKVNPVFTVYKTLPAISQVYYAQLDGGLVCSDRLDCLACLLDDLEPDESVLPLHFLFRSIPGDLTYYRGVRRMIPGERLTWNAGRLDTRLVKTLDMLATQTPSKDDSPAALERLYCALEAVVQDYAIQTLAHGGRIATLLSGGVDSTLLQHLISRLPGNGPKSTFSFVIDVPAFGFEVEYARQAAARTGADHHFVHYTPQEYPGLQNRTIELLAQPPALETEASMLAIAEYMQSERRPESCFFSGQGADALFGLSGARKLKAHHILSRLPAARALMRGAGLALQPFTARSVMLIKGAEMIAQANNADSYVSPLNTITVYDVDLSILERSFGADGVRRALAYRREFVQRYSVSRHYLERVFFIDLLTDAYEVSCQRQQLFLAHGLEQAHPYFDEDLITAALAFDPDIRYVKGFTAKHLLKRILASKTGASDAFKRKGASTVNDDLDNWMKNGPLRPQVEAIERPAFLSKADFEKMASRPNYFLWSLLTYDIFRKQADAAHSTLLPMEMELSIIR